MKCDSILARTLFYMLPEIPDDGGPSESQARVDFHVQKPLVINITDKHVAILWKLINGMNFEWSFGGFLIMLLIIVQLHKIPRVLQENPNRNHPK